jgi:hypothetical protein
VAVAACLGVPALSYGFCFRLARLRHRKRPEREPFLRDISARELEALLARALPQPALAQSGGVEGIM